MGASFSRRTGATIGPSRGRILEADLLAKVHDQSGPIYLQLSQLVEEPQQQNQIRSTTELTTLSHVEEESESQQLTDAEENAAVQVAFSRPTYLHCCGLIYCSIPTLMQI